MIPLNILVTALYQIGDALVMSKVQLHKREEECLRCLRALATILYVLLQAVYVKLYVEKMIHSSHKNYFLKVMES